MPTVAFKIEEQKLETNLCTSFFHNLLLSGSTTPLLSARTNENVLSNSKGLEENNGVTRPKNGPDHVRYGISLNISNHMCPPF